MFAQATAKRETTKQSKAGGTKKTSRAVPSNDKMPPTKKARVSSPQPKVGARNSLHMVVEVLKKGPNRKKKAFKLGKVTN